MSSTPLSSDVVPTYGAEPLLENLFTNPSLRRTQLLTSESEIGETEASASGDWVYVHKHCHVELVPDGDGQAFSITGTTASTDTHISPGGRDGALRLGMEAGRTYTFAADVVLVAPLVGVLHANALRIVVGWVVDGRIEWRAARSPAAQNVSGRTRLAVTYTIPEDASEAWVRLYSGAAKDKGTVRWSRIHLSEGVNGRVFVDGATEAEDGLEASWQGEPDGSASELRLTSAFDVDRLDQLLAEWIQLGGFGVAMNAADAAIAQSPLHHALRAAQEGAWADVARICEVAIDDDPTTLAPRVLMATAGVRTKQQERVVAALKPVLGDPAITAEFCYLLGKAHQELGQRDDVREAYRVGADRDSRVDAETAAQLLEVTQNFFPERAASRRFVAAHIEQIRRMALRSRSGKDGAMPYVFVYWAQGMESAPAIVRACYERLQRVPGIDVRLITAETAPYWVQIPSHIRTRIPATKAWFADWLRIALLKEYGGIWVDATCYVTGDLAVVEELVGERRFFAFRYGDARISNWFLAARDNSYMVHMIHAALEVYWRSHDEGTNYFFFHDLFEALAQVDQRFGELWETKGQHRDSGIPHKLQGLLRGPSGTGEDLEAIDGSFVHKLTYKLKPHEIAPGTVAGALVRGEYEQHLIPDPPPPDKHRWWSRRLLSDA